jgi:DNA-directed RNA polymerase subunit L
MFVEIADIKDNEIELTIREEDISILYILQHELLKTQWKLYRMLPPLHRNTLKSFSA